ncbi:ABC transporter ATP-binding protein [Clostridium botulinum]|uniref:ABC transporter, ATP-binding protein n=1 Tax=Clostridium botulinum (strain Okra / Type B1) TaxID=498213 RepID=B1ILU3_CLOBK|nr:ABC transporter ATP-binding protein [Clostridium botulinum]ACA46845.1 ABC transporter, ATP-binding protein [Clostridium botulinum B1 str. Okra]MBD5562435.1 ABC transporter ATP-binding protein [Clostridium botulinum]MBD5566170.1 ABC transporter ATP-binding protein [Clostridium botulinum]MBD5569314.1 ABC transporter ATP-binding protein [Clostridium botulinum]MBD5576069.1 ABC transporter ATP-binding protein [Clostridium botulinum]
MEDLLIIRDLSVYYENEKLYKAVDNVSFTLKTGENIGVIGESGSGKTSIAMAIMGLLRANVKVQGEIIYKDKNILKLKNEEKNKYRWNKIALVFQNSLEALNPVLNIKGQILEVIYKHLHTDKKEALDKVKDLLKMVGLSEDIGEEYPHNLSGGMRQKVLIAMALACDPEVLIVDEPTSALDNVSKNEIIKLLKMLQNKNNMTMIVISHDLYVIDKLTTKLEVVYKGNLLEEGYTKEIINNPMHTYTRGIINSSIEINPFGDLWGIPNEEVSSEEGCTFYGRCVQRSVLCKKNKPNLSKISDRRKVCCNKGGIINLLTANSLRKVYKTKYKKVSAVNYCNLSIRSGEIVSLIGESGSGKSTLANILSGILKPDEGQVYFNDEKLEGNKFTSKKFGIQIIFQDPISAINSSFTIMEAIREPLDIIKDGSIEDRNNKVLQVLNKVQLPTEKYFVNKKCNELSGGQRQRVSIARALIMEPTLLIADEISSMLDPSTKANILRLLKQLQNLNGFSMLYITHDINLAKKISDKILVMNSGKIVESGSVLEVLNNPKNVCTKRLIC